MMSRPWKPPPSAPVRVPSVATTAARWKRSSQPISRPPSRPWNHSLSGLLAKWPDTEGRGVLNTAIVYGRSSHSVLGYSESEYLARGPLVARQRGRCGHERADQALLRAGGSALPRQGRPPALGYPRGHRLRGHRAPRERTAGKNVALSGRSKLSWLRQFLPLTHGIPSHEAFRRVFMLIDPDAFEACFTAWVHSLSEPVEHEVTRIDGEMRRFSSDQRLEHSGRLRTLSPAV